jgi:hypothetical protein
MASVSAAAKPFIPLFGRWLCKCMNGKNGDDKEKENSFSCQMWKGKTLRICLSPSDKL